MNLFKRSLTKDSNTMVSGERQRHCRGKHAKMSQCAFDKVTSLPVWQAFTPRSTHSAIHSHCLHLGSRDYHLIHRLDCVSPTLRKLIVEQLPPMVSTIRCFWETQPWLVDSRTMVAKWKCTEVADVHLYTKWETAITYLCGRYKITVYFNLSLYDNHILQCTQM